MKGTRMKKIIIIDDDPGILDSIRLVFSQLDYHITNYTNGNAILAGKFEMPDIFIIDKQLPGIDGLDICKYLKKNEATKDIPVIIMSASPSIDKAAKAAGSTGFIEKPYTIKLLREMVAKFISGNHSTK